MIYHVKSYEECISLLKYSDLRWVWSKDISLTYKYGYLMNDYNKTNLLPAWKDNWEDHESTGSKLYIVNMSYHILMSLQ